MSDVTRVAANGNEPKCAATNYCKWMDEDYILTVTVEEMSAAPGEIRVVFPAEEAAAWGWESNVVTTDFLDYLMGDLVADEDCDASQALKKQVARYS
ncbi:hypothetical protein [Rhizobium halophilum]|uniref:hypothetical protein n=1 Tax=Rhizobium halophilum TaxID=2846852 RepID=UPI001EFD5651|nr:hypothetical protein [Rhizobium halophilum]MCF6369496.1 hypothetical protein [Rhizobium halophilum]